MKYVSLLLSWRCDLNNPRVKGKTTYLYHMHFCTQRIIISIPYILHYTHHTRIVLIHRHNFQRYHSM